MKHHLPPDPPLEPPPPLGAWRRVYVLVAVWAVGWMAFLYAVTRAFDVPGAR